MFSNFQKGSSCDKDITMNDFPKATAIANSFPSFDALMAHLDSVGLFHMDLRLTRTEDALKKLVPTTKMQVVQVLGTNGKGSTCTFLAGLAQGHGLCTGLYTSPHFVSPRERIRINGHMLPESLWLELGNSIHTVAPTLTYFEFLTVLAFMAFDRAGVQLAIMEAGLGGRHDATTALPVNLLCYTPIAMDHETVLGDTLAEIASDKADAIRQGAPVLTGPQKPEAMACLEQTAAQKGSVLWGSESNTLDLGDQIAQIPLGLRGPHQQHNARLALAAWRYLAGQNHWPVKEATERTALRTAFVPGRLQYVPATHGHDAGLRAQAASAGLSAQAASAGLSTQGASAPLPALILDGGHNPHGLQALATALKASNTTLQAVIFSCLADKNFAGMLGPLLQVAGSAPIFVPTIPNNPRATPAAQLVALMGPQAQTVQSLPQALALATALCAQPTAPPHKGVLICGSLYLLAEFFRLYPQYLSPLHCEEPV